MMAGKGVRASGNEPALDENQLGEAWADLGASFGAGASGDRMSFSLRSLTEPDLLDRATADLDPETRAFWAALSDEVAAHGAGGVGKFERYFRIFRTRLLPFVHSRRTLDDTFISRPRPER